MQEIQNSAFTSTLWGGGCGRGGLVACLLLFAAQWRRSKLLTTHQVVDVDLAQRKKKWCVPQTAGLQRDPPPVLQPAPALTVVVGVVFCASLGPCACTMLCVRMAFPSDGGSCGGNSTASHPMWPHRIHAIPDSHQGCRSRTLSAPVVPVGLALVPTLNTLGSPLAPKPVRPRLAGACPV